VTGAPEKEEDLHSYALQLTAGELPAGWDIVNTSSACLVARNAAMQIYYKEFPLPSPIDRLRALLRGSRASRWRQHSDALTYAGIDAPQSLAWGKLPNGREYLFTRQAAGQDVATWLRKTLAERSGDALGCRRRLLEALGIFIGRLHATGFLPGDLEPSDILAEQVDGRFQFTLINNEHSVKKLPPPGRMLLKNLSELNLLPPSALGKTDRMRFFVAWRRQMRELSSVETKVLAAEAYQRAMLLMRERGQL